MTLTYFTAKSYLFPYAFVWEKDKNNMFVYDIKVGRLSIQWVHEALWIAKVNAIHWASSKVTQVQPF